EAGDAAGHEHGGEPEQTPARSGRVREHATMITDRLRSGMMSVMRLGVVFPQTEIGADPGGVRAYAQGVEEIGYTHLLAYDHVLGADASSRKDWAGPY